VAVRDGVADLGFVEGPVDEPALSVTPVADDELVLVVGAMLKPKRRAPSADDLKAMRWVSREQGSATRALFEQALAKVGVRLDDIDLVLELPSNEAVRAAVEDGTGAAVLSKLVVASSLESGALVALDFAVPTRQFFALRHKEHTITQAEREFYKLIEQSPEAADRTAAAAPPKQA